MQMINTKIIFSCFELKTHVKNSMDYIYYFLQYLRLILNLILFNCN